MHKEWANNCASIYQITHNKRCSVVRSVSVGWLAIGVLVRVMAVVWQLCLFIHDDDTAAQQSSAIFTSADSDRSADK